MGTELSYGISHLSRSENGITVSSGIIYGVSFTIVLLINDKRFNSGVNRKLTIQLHSTSLVIHNRVLLV